MKRLCNKTKASTDVTHDILKIYVRICEEMFVCDDMTSCTDLARRHVVDETARFCHCSV